jgi:hypothetical protein
MPQPGSFKISGRPRAVEADLPGLRGARRVERILDSLRLEIRDPELQVRARRIFARPREIFRLEIESIAMAYQRTTLLDRDALDELMAIDEIRDRLQLQID